MGVFSDIFSKCLKHSNNSRCNLESFLGEVIGKCFTHWMVVPGLTKGTRKSTTG